MISGIDIALWDIRGKVLGLPISELFGGPVREGVPIYCHPQNGSSIENTVQHVRAIVDTGHEALKLDPWQPKHEEESNGYLSGKLSAEAERLGTERVAAIREAVGPDIEVLIDCHGRFDVPTAIRLGKALEPYDIYWFEEPAPVESIHALRQVRDRDGLPRASSRFARIGSVVMLAHKQRLKVYCASPLNYRPRGRVHTCDMALDTS
ncbi:hypothetical protein CMK11_12340 [Candidatus Poribacteria bacterium]|nr:hypothetical protein [Candidatus Poribacteria bacterium]